MTGICLGIVVQNNDPQKRGRVKVFIPHVSLNLLEGWENLNEDKTFEKLSDPKIKDVIDDIKNQLPWANCAAPIVGEVGNHIFNAFSTTSGSGDAGDRSGNKPAKAIEDTPPEDSFDNVYQHNSYNSTGKGLFSVPRVGSKVWVFFENGNLNRPVYFATAYNQSDWNNVSNDNYPDKLENYSKADGGETDNTYQNKMVISQRGGVIEIVNTDSKESLQISHYNGGFKLWNNNGTQEYVKGAERKLISGSKFSTIGSNDDCVIIGNKSVEVGENLNVVVKGNANITITGTANLISDEDFTIESKKNVIIKSGENIQLNP